MNCIYEFHINFVSEGSKKGVTVAILKPNIVAAGKVDEIIAKVNYLPDVRQPRDYLNLCSLKVA